MRIGWLAIRFGQKAPAAWMGRPPRLDHAGRPNGRRAMTDAFPLSWPSGWPRTDPYKRESRFQGRDRFTNRAIGLTMGRARDQLIEELKLLGAKEIIVSTNAALRLDGLPYAEQRKISDPGVAVYFQLKKRPLVMAT